MCLWSLCCVLCLGHLTHFCFEKYPNLKQMMHFIEREEVLYQIDANTNRATADNATAILSEMFLTC